MTSLVGAASRSRSERAVDEEHGARRLRSRVEPKADVSVDILGRAIDPAALLAVEGHFLAVHGEEVLAEELPEVLEEISEAPDDGIVAPHGMGLLGAIDDVHDRDRNNAYAHQPHQRHRHDVENPHR